MIDFRRLTLDDRPALEQILQKVPERGCEYSFANLYLWGRQQVAFVGEDLVFFSQFDRKSVYLFPVGTGDRKQTLDAVIHDAAARGIPCRLTCLTQDDCALVEQMYPGRVQTHIDRNSFDYVYSMESLAELSGRKYQRKRNHVNRFFQEHPHAEITPITQQNIENVRQMVNLWYDQRLQDDPTQDFCMERIALGKALRDYDRLGMTGVILEEDGKTLAMTMASRLNEDTFDIHFEKALERSDGVYGAINREFARYLRRQYPQIRWLNREDDMGLEGLRKAKMSYCPDRMVEKSWIRLLEDGYDD